jgi:hypothetical protein
VCISGEFGGLDAICGAWLGLIDCPRYFYRCDRVYLSGVGLAGIQRKAGFYGDMPDRSRGNGYQD